MEVFLMDWKREAKNELRDLPVIREAVRSIPERLQMIESKKTGLGSSSTDRTPVQGGGTPYEDRLLNLIVEGERLTVNMEVNRIRLQLIERGLSALSAQDRLIVETFAEHRPSEAVDLLADKLYLERSRIYQLWDQALRRYTIAEFGLTDF